MALNLTRNVTNLTKRVHRNTEVSTMVVQSEEVGTSYAPGYTAIPSSSTYDPPPPMYPLQQGLADLEEDDFNKFATTLEQSNIAVRMNFVRKVYSILAVQMGLTTIIGAFCMYNA
ncbi:hypothetical protein HK096_001832, partial [Nowakowskiella sp. JEL0078]